LQADVALNFNTCFVSAVGELLTDRREIARAYMGGWFFLDCMGSLPISLVLALSSQTSSANGDAGQGAGVKVAKILKAPKMLRLGYADLT
jgi:hypothetical protein